MLCRWRYLIPEFPETYACVTGCTIVVRHIRSFSGPSKLFWYTYRLDIYIVYTLYIHCIYICVRTPTLHECSLALAALRAAALARSLLASAPALLHEVQLAEASIHVTYVCVCKVDTMYIYNLYVDQKSFEVPTMRSHARKRKYLFGTSGDACVIFREVWEMNITFCCKSTFCLQILS